MQFANLLPNTIFDAVSEQGLVPTGTLFSLNSYENRVYEIHLEDHDPIVAKFYRPGRWSAQTIADEHRFLKKLEEVEIPVVVPLPLKKSASLLPTLGQSGEYPFAFFPKFRGREHADITNDDRQWLGRTLGRLHNIGEVFKAEHRLRLNPETYGYASLDYILKQTFIPGDLKTNLETILKAVLKRIEPFFPPGLKMIALHGDCHPGNILWNVQGPHLLDFDDMVVAPPVQDLWMLFHGSEEEKAEQREAFFKGYRMFRDFDEHSFRLTEPLRSLRMIRHAAWIGQRFEEPVFQKAFPYYRESRYWEQFLLSMKEQLSLLQEL